MKTLDELVPNTPYLICWTAAMVICTTFQTGFVLAENNQAAYIIIAKFGWDEEEALMKNTILTSLGILGLAIGSVYGSVFCAKLGLRKTLLLAQITSLGANILKISVFNYVTFLVARFIFGVSCGVLGFSFGKCLNETIPLKKVQDYGLANNMGINLGIMICGFLSIILPLSDSPIKERQENESWRIVYGFTIVPQVISIVSIAFFIKHPSLNQLIQNNRREEAMNEIAKIYKTDQLAEAYDLIKASLSVDTSDISTKDALMSPKYRRSTWNGVFLTFFNQLTGITGVLVFSTTIFKEMKDSGSFDIPIIVAIQILNISNWIGTFLCALPSKCFSQKQILQGGLFILFLSLVLIVVFIQIQFNAGILMFMAVFVVTFQGSIGGITFIHINETCMDKSSGIGQLFLFTWVLTIAQLTPYMIAGIGNKGMFLFFACSTFFGNLYMKFGVRDTTFRIDENGEKVRLTDKEKKELYQPKNINQVSDGFEVPPAIEMKKVEAIIVDTPLTMAESPSQNKENQMVA